MKKRGFTLIEVLGVIILIGIIALITSPVVINLIDVAKKESYKNSSLSLFRAAELYETENGFVDISIDGISINNPDFPIANEDYTSGKIIRNNDDRLQLINVTDGIYCVNGTTDSVSVIVGNCDSINNIAPSDISIEIVKVTSNSISVKVYAEDSIYGIKNYQYSIDGTNYTTKNENTHTFTELGLNKTYTIYVRVRNNNNVTSEEITKQATTKDITVPTYSVDKTGWQTQKTVTINYPPREENYVYQYSLNGGTTWTTALIGTTKSITFNAPCSIIARVFDGTNYKTASSYTVSQIDATAPTGVNVSLISKTTNSMTVRALGTDAESGIGKYEFSIDGGAYIENGTNATYTFTGVTTGNHTVKVRLTNYTALTTESDNVTLSPNDIVSPTYSVNKTGWQTQKIVTITYPTRETGFVYQYSINGGTTWTTVSSGTTQTVTFNANGSVIARIYDGTNYKTASSYTVTNIDTTAPSAGVTLSSKTTNTITVVASGSDSESGITKYEFSIDGGPYISNGTNTTYTFTGVTTGNHTIKVRTTNGSGLTTESSVITVAPNEITAPTYAINKTGWQTQKIVTITYPTRETGFVYQYSINGGTTWTTVSSGTTQTVTFNANGSVIARIYDGTNYKTSSSYTVTNIDTTAPSAGVTLSSKTTNTITVVASGTDSESGITKYEFSIDGGTYISNGLNIAYTFVGVTTGNHTVRVRTTNGSGLTTESSVLTVSPTEITTPTYTINATGWQPSKIVTISYPVRETGFIYQYSTNGGSSWTTVSSGTTQTVTFNANGSVIARVFDGTNYKTASSYTVSGIDATAPTAGVTLSSKTTNAITVVASGSDSESGITKYEFSIDGGTYISNGTNTLYTFTGVTAGNHTIKVRTTNGSGLTKESSILSVSPNDITAPTYAIDKTGWQQQKIVTITYPARQTGFVYQYSINGGSSWTTVSSGTTQTVTFNANGTVIARIYDGTNYKTASTYTVSQVDNSAPTYSSYEIKNITVTGYDVYLYGVSDSGSGINRIQFPTWTDNNGQDDIQPSWTTNSVASGTNLGSGTWYYRVNVSAHNNESGLYNTHVYLYDNVGRSTAFSAPKTTVPANKVTSKLPDGIYTVGQAITYAGINWHVINVNGSQVTLLADHGTISSRMRFDTRYNSSYPSCPYSPTGYCGNNTWSSSELKTYLNGTWLTNSQLSTSYMVDTGNGYVRLITNNEYNTLKSTVGGQTWLYSATINWWWTMTASTEYKLYAVTSDGNVSSMMEAFDNSYARPVVTVEREISYTCASGTLTYDAGRGGYICVTNASSSYNSECILYSNTSGPPVYQNTYLSCGDSTTSDSGPGYYWYITCSKTSYTDSCGNNSYSCTHYTFSFPCLEYNTSYSYYCPSGWSNYSGSGSSLKCYKAATQG